MIHLDNVNDTFRLQKQYVYESQISEFDSIEPGTRNAQQ